MKSLLLALLILFAFSLLQGCNTLAETEAARGTAVVREYSAPHDVVWEAVPAVLDELSLSLVRIDHDQNCILAEHSVSAFSFGEKVAIFVGPAGSGATPVEVVSKKAMSTNVLAPDWAKDTLDKLGQKLAPE